MQVNITRLERFSFHRWVNSTPHMVGQTPFMNRTLDVDRTTMVDKDNAVYGDSAVDGGVCEGQTCSVVLGYN